MSKLKALTFDQYKVAAKRTLDEAADEEPDVVIVLMFHRGAGQFKIKCSKIESRLELIGALEEAKNHVIVNGYAS
jgi:2',3'-cyclic-nucleotide 2'-phosphodiesterase (5'-nucleotidase family)